jgi:hypothetical protein
MMHPFAVCCQPQPTTGRTGLPLDIRQNVAGAIVCDQRAQAELSMTRQKFVRAAL